MNKGHLSEYFTGVAAKRLSTVETDPAQSNQHEFNGDAQLKNLLGLEKLKDITARFVWLDEEYQGFSVTSYVTWYDAREKHPERSEYRLYFRSNPVMERASAGDLLVVAKRPSGELMIIVAAKDSTEENELLWFFGLSDHQELTGLSTHVDVIGASFTYKSVSDRTIDYAEKFLLDEIGIEDEEEEAARLDEILEPFNGVFPQTKVFSQLVRQNLPEIEPREDPDAALLEWMIYETKLFKRLERQIVTSTLEKGFHVDGEVDADSFIEFSLSVHNRRKSRAGSGLEHHIEAILASFELQYDVGKVTENKQKPDFLFPGIDEYRDSNFPEDKLVMLAAKTTCKDRWRQVLVEAKRITDENRYLLTLERSISENQTNQMNVEHLQLVLPRKLHNTYTDAQQAWLIDVSEFIKIVGEKQMYYGQLQVPFSG